MRLAPVTLQRINSRITRTASKARIFLPSSNVRPRKTDRHFGEARAALRQPRREFRFEIESVRVDVHALESTTTRYIL